MGLISLLKNYLKGKLLHLKYSLFSSLCVIKNLCFPINGYTIYFFGISGHINSTASLGINFESVFDMYIGVFRTGGEK